MICVCVRVCICIYIYICIRIHIFIFHLFIIIHVSGFPQADGPADAIRRSSLPSVLISTKCDTPIAQRELDPVKIERGARNSIGGIGLVQTSAHDAGAEKHKEAVAMILKQIIFGKAGAANPRHNSQFCL